MANRQTSSSSSKKDPTPKQITKTTPAKTPESEFKAKVRKVCDVVGWPAEDVSRVLKESESNVEVAIDKILSGKRSGGPSFPFFLVATHCRDESFLAQGMLAIQAMIGSPRRRRRTKTLMTSLPRKYERISSAAAARIHH